METRKKGAANTFTRLERLKSYFILVMIKDTSYVTVRLLRIHTFVLTRPLGHSSEILYRRSVRYTMPFKKTAKRGDGKINVGRFRVDPTFVDPIPLCRRTASGYEEMDMSC